MKESDFKASNIKMYKRESEAQRVDVQTGMQECGQELQQCDKRERQGGMAVNKCLKSKIETFGKSVTRGAYGQGW
jgi:hypothetical protein